MSSRDPDCIFCRIIAGGVRSRRVYEDDHAYAFLDLGAWHRGHTLVVPKRHVRNLLDGPPAMAEIGNAVDAVSRLLVERLHADGLNLVSSSGAVAGQEVFHLHLHLVPRYAAEPGLPKLFSAGPVSDDELDAVHDQITGGG